MVLWKKESACDNALFVDLFPSNFSVENKFGGFPEIAKKDDELSTQLRVSGNGEFQSKCWREAMELYNKSLRFATEESENISLAYANRSACFLHMKKFNECMADIELAKKANYPQRLMPKLNQREAECLKLMDESKKVETKVKPVLNFDPDDKFPCIANVLEIRSNEEFGKHIVARGNIEVGQIILADEAFVFDDTKCDRTNCENCLKFVTNLIPCPNCTDVMFCGTQCMGSNNIHKMGCGTSFHVTPCYKDLVQTVLIAVSAFPDVNELMKFVEKSLETRDFGSLEGISGAQLRYGQFLKLAAVRIKMTATGVVSVYQLLFQIPRIKQLFDSKQKQRFLMHLLWQHLLIIETNGIDIEDENNKIGFVGNFASLFNHACYDNIGLDLCGNQIIGYAVRPIEKGEQLFIRYITSTNQSTEERKGILWNDFQFECKCSMCVPRFKQIDCIRMQSDPVFPFSGQPTTEDTFLDQKKRIVFEEKLRQFLSKYGRLPWSSELNLAVLGFKTCMHEDLKLIQHYSIDC